MYTCISNKYGINFNILIMLLLVNKEIQLYKFCL